MCVIYERTNLSCTQESKVETIRVQPIDPVSWCMTTDDEDGRRKLDARRRRRTDDDVWTTNDDDDISNLFYDLYQF